MTLVHQIKYINCQYKVKNQHQNSIFRPKLSNKIKYKNKKEFIKNVILNPKNSQKKREINYKAFGQNINKEGLFHYIIKFQNPYQIKMGF